MTLAIEAVDLRKTYPPAVTALDGISLAVETGTIFGLLGPNGAGKSTTVHVLTTLLPPTSGSARVAGHDVVHEGPAVRAAIPAVLAALDAQGVTAKAVTLARPSLDDVYLRHAGRAFHETDDTQQEAA